MNQVLAEAKKHWRSQLAEPMASVEVPEWSTTLFFKPSNLAQRDRIYKHINEGKLEALVETIIQRALDADGKRVFNEACRKDLMTKTDPDVIGRIVTAMSDEEDVTPEEARKNSE
jgi:hypothetical protein